MARIFAYCDSPTANTGFGRSAQHVLYPLHEAGHEIVQLAVNHDPTTEDRIPWKVYSPVTRGADPYGLDTLAPVVIQEGPFDLLWTTFDPEVPFNFQLPGVQPQLSVLQFFQTLKASNPGFRMLGWFPVDGGPLSEVELMVLGSEQFFNVAATMSPHVHDLVAWTLKLRGLPAVREEIEKRIPIVPHGIDMGVYSVATDEDRRAAKAALGFDPDCFLVIQVERNQQRKQVWLGLDLLEKLRAMRPKDDVRLYQHMDEDEETKGAHAGWRLRELAWRYGLRADVDVRWRQKRYSEEEMTGIVYAAADVFVSTSCGEGFQYPAWEALACGRRVVLPNDSARAAWLSNTPGAHLYKAAQRAMVVRGGYNRRMSHPDVADAARIIGKMVDERPKYAECSEASRNWVDRTASLDKVRGWWVKAVNEQIESLYAERSAQGVQVMAEEQSDFVIDVRANPGLGDLVLMGPAMRAFRKKHEGKTVCLALPSAGDNLMLAQALGLADRYQTHPRAQLEDLGRVVIELSSLWHPVHREGWSDPQKHRTDVVAGFLGVEPEPCFQVNLPDDMRSQLVSMVQEQYGVHPSECVVICAESGSPHRALPLGHLQQIIELVLARGMVPVLVGRQLVQIGRVGLLNLSGQTDLTALVALLGGAAAVIATDSGPMHFAAMQGTPLVALMPLFPASSRLSYYPGPIEILEPGVAEIDGEAYPPGKAPKAPPGAWAGAIAPARVAEALDELIAPEPDVDDAGELPIRYDPGPQDLGQPKVVTAADLGVEPGPEAGE